ncbi:MAG: ImmA/IrrE family metallo-endopeptidase [Dethiobacter sp.]|nr:ImmA/IrrE family metallo-endopeptidase [Dethiobacter sp.]MBS3898677.1 ImmA/IrrE family metallo-endopeptidase [Dethiobacter sp.]
MYETLLHEAEEERIDVVYRPLRGKIKGLYCNGVIAINRNISSTTEKACILAEELGHYHSSVGNILDQSKLQNRKQECRARAWSYQKLVPLEKLIQAHKEGIRARHDLAEFLGITEQFLMSALQNYKEKHGYYCRVGDYWIYFEPLGILEIRQQELKPAENEVVFLLY